MNFSSVFEAMNPQQKNKPHHVVWTWPNKMMSNFGPRNFNTKKKFQDIIFAFWREPLSKHEKHKFLYPYNLSLLIKKLKIN